MSKRFCWTLAVVAVTAAVSLTVGLWLAYSQGSARAQRRHDAAALSEAWSRAAAVDGEKRQLVTMVSLAARNPSFRDFYGVGVSGQDRVATDVVLRDVDEALLFVQALRPGALAEVCFIDRGGRENARAVRGEVAQRADGELSDERENEFFARTLNVPVGQVFVAAPYRSPDTGELVIAVSTNVANADGQATSLLHFELTLDALRDALELDRERLRVVDESAGMVVIDSRLPDAVPGTGGSALVVSQSGADGVVTADGGRVAFVRVLPGAYDATRLLVAVDVDTGGPTFGDLSTPLTTSLMAAGLLGVIAVAAALWHRRLRGQVMRDPLTGLPNRLAFTATTERHAAHHTTFAVALFDLDRFKAINDSFGHRVGDEVLIEVANRLRSVLTRHETAVRLGGDEFAIVFAGGDAAHTERAIERIATALHAPLVLGSVPIEIRASVGVALPEHGGGAGELLRKADVAMYHAKTNRLRVAVFEPEMDRGTSDQLTLLDDLREAIASGHLEVHYQPKIDLANGAVTGVEALARWTHPTRGPIAASDFVALAESSDVITALTDVVLSDAVVRCRAWRAVGHNVHVAVNLSARLLADDGLATRVLAALATHALPAKYLVLEITETAVMTDPVVAHRQLARLAAAGVTLALDDFGTGMTSLAQLHSLPLRELKLDRSFVVNLENPATCHIVRSVINLAHDLGLYVVAEGVEDAETANRLFGLGCHGAQGFNWTPALAPPALDRWLADRLVESWA